MKTEFSLRYIVIGLYVDRSRRTVRIYPIPFVRISIGKAAR